MPVGTEQEHKLLAPTYHRAGTSSALSITGENNVAMFLDHAPNLVEQYERIPSAGNYSAAIRTHFENLDHHGDLAIPSGRALGGQDTTDFYGL